MSVLATTSELPKSLKIRPQTLEDISLTKSSHNLCRVSLLHSNSTCQYNDGGLLFISEGTLENKEERYDGKGK